MNPSGLSKQQRKPSECKGDSQVGLQGHRNGLDFLLQGAKALSTLLMIDMHGAVVRTWSQWIDMSGRTAPTFSASAREFTSILESKKQFGPQLSVLALLERWRG